MVRVLKVKFPLHLLYFKKEKQNCILCALTIPDKHSLIFIYQCRNKNENKCPHNLRTSIKSSDLVGLLVFRLSIYLIYCFFSNTSNCLYKWLSFNRTTQLKGTENDCCDWSQPNLVLFGFFCGENSGF